MKDERCRYEDENVRANRIALRCIQYQFQCTPVDRIEEKNCLGLERQGVKPETGERGLRTTQYLEASSCVDEEVLVVMTQAAFLDM